MLPILALLLAALMGGPARVTAQSLSSASVSGMIRGDNGLPVGQALVTLSVGSAEASYRATTTRAGTFTIPLVQPGTYSVRVEALGYRPLVATGLTLGGGDERSVTLTLSVTRPPVTTVDSVRLTGEAASRVRPGGVQVGGQDLRSLPFRYDDLPSAASVSTAFDASLGARGLPGDLTLVVADGVPFYRAPHPTARVEHLPNALFPRSALASVTAIHDGTDIEMAGAAGGYVSVATRGPATGAGLEFEGAWSGDPAWSSSELDLETPSLLSVQGALAGTVRLSPASSLVVSGEGLRGQTPLSPRVGEGVAAELSGLDPDLLSDLSAPGVETYSRYSGLLRYDLQRSATSRFFFRGAGALSERAFAGAAGPVTLAGPSAPAEESVEFSGMLGFVGQPSRSLSAEVRAGVSGSYRTFDAGLEGRPPARLVQSGAVLGSTYSAEGESSRTDVIITPLMRYLFGSATTLKFGANIRVSRHSMSHSMASSGDFVYSSPPELLVAQGFGQVTDVPETSFGTQEYGLFAQLEGDLAPNVRVVLGGRYDRERLGSASARRNDLWFIATGMETNRLPSAFNQFGARLSIAWDVGGTGRTRIAVGTSLHEGDLDTRALYQTLAQSVDGTSARYSGVFLDWPSEGSLPPAAMALGSFTMLGPDVRAPRTSSFDLTLSQKLGDAMSAFVRGTTRRTDFLLRRRNLNLPLVPQALDPWGRSMYGTLQQIGSTVVTTNDDARRFADFGEVWALDPDGWSEYTGVTLGIEYATPIADVHASYTWSETLDNWVGAGEGVVGASLPPGLPEVEGEAEWSEGISDFDVPHRAEAGATLQLGPAALGVFYRFESGLPFTPGYRVGVDANGDGSIWNDVAFVSESGEVDALAGDWPCLRDQAGAFATRNSCRGPDRHSLNVRLQFRLGDLAGRTAHLSLDGLNLAETAQAVVDDALLLVDPQGSISTSPGGETVTIPVVVNPGFGRALYHTGRGRMIRIGVRIGG